MKCTVSVAVSRPYLLEVIFNDGGLCSGRCVIPSSSGKPAWVMSLTPLPGRTVPI